MTEQYVQTVDVLTSAKTKAYFIIGLVALMASLAFLIVAVLKNYWFFVGFGALFLLGFVLVQIFESAPSQFVYGATGKRIVFSKRNNAHNAKRIVSIPYDKIIDFDRFADIVCDGDVIACENTGAEGVYALKFVDEDGSDKRVLFSPDDYLLAFLQENLKEGNDVENHLS